MSPHQKLQALRPLIDLAIQSAASLPPASRADIYEGLALAIGDASERLRTEAQSVCETLRAAEIHQLTFASFLRPESQNPTP